MPHTDTLTYRGKKVTDMTRDELIEALALVARNMKRRDEQDVARMKRLKL